LLQRICRTMPLFYRLFSPRGFFFLFFLV